MAQSSSALRVGMRRTIEVILGAVLAACSATAQSNLDVCRVTTDTRFTEGGTGIYEVGKFPIDNVENGISKSFQYQWDKQAFIINVDIQYGDMADVEKGRPTRLMLSLLARRVEDENDKGILPVEAETQYRHKWGSIALSTNVLNGDLTQHFELRCSDGLSKNGLQRGEPKWLKKIKKNRED